MSEVGFSRIIQKWNCIMQVNIFEVSAWTYVNKTKTKIKEDESTI